MKKGRYHNSIPDKKEFDIEVETPEIFEEDIMVAENLKISPYVAFLIRRIKELIDSHTSVLLFVNTRQMAEILSSRFNLMEMNFIDVHHSSFRKKLESMWKLDLRRGD